MFKMAKKILAIDGSSSGPGGSSSSSSKKSKGGQKGAASGEDGFFGPPPPGGKPKTTDELGDFSKLEDDPRLPLNVRQIFKITKSWKAIARTMCRTGTAMFLNLFEQNEDLFYLFDRFQHLKRNEIQESMELKEHAATVMSTLDQSISSLNDYDNFVNYLHSIGELHRKVPEFRRDHFWKIEEPFMKAVKQTLDERCNETIEEIYRIAIKLIIETIADGYGHDDEAGSSSKGANSGTGGDSGGSGGPANSKGRNGAKDSSAARGGPGESGAACPGSKFGASGNSGDGGQRRHNVITDGQPMDDESNERDCTQQHLQCPQMLNSKVTVIKQERSKNVSMIEQPDCLCHLDQRLFLNNDSTIIDNRTGASRDISRLSRDGKRVNLAMSRSNCAHLQNSKGLSSSSRDEFGNCKKGIGCPARREPSKLTSDDNDGAKLRATMATLKQLLAAVSQRENQQKSSKNCPKSGDQIDPLTLSRVVAASDKNVNHHHHNHHHRGVNISNLKCSKLDTEEIRRLTSSRDARDANPNKLMNVASQEEEEEAAREVPDGVQMSYCPSVLTTARASKRSAARRRAKTITKRGQIQVVSDNNDNNNNNNNNENNNNNGDNRTGKASRKQTANQISLCPSLVSDDEETRIAGIDRPNNNNSNSELFQMQANDDTGHHHHHSEALRISHNDTETDTITNNSKNLITERLAGKNYVIRSLITKNNNNNKLHQHRARRRRNPTLINKRARRPESELASSLGCTDGGAIIARPPSQRKICAKRIENKLARARLATRNISKLYDYRAIGIKATSAQSGIDERIEAEINGAGRRARCMCYNGTPNSIETYYHVSRSLYSSKGGRKQTKANGRIATLTNEAEGGDDDFQYGEANLRANNNVCSKAPLKGCNEHIEQLKPIDDKLFIAKLIGNGNVNGNRKSRDVGIAKRNNVDDSCDSADRGSGPRVDNGSNGAQLAESKLSANPDELFRLLQMLMRTLRREDDGRVRCKEELDSIEEMIRRNDKSHRTVNQGMVYG